jgi:pimeloyl-ACP methyl ester carboxylesterase
MRAAALAGLLLTAGCAGGPPAASGPASAPPPASTAAALDGCFSAARGTIETVPGASGDTLTLASVGTGPRVVVLSNESDQDLCSWLPFAGRLTAAGYRAVLWDYGGDLPTDELARLVKHLRADGAARLVLMGASEGAKASLIAGAHLKPAVQGVVSLSAEAILQPGIVVVSSVRRVHCPLLLLTAKDDPYGSAQAARQFLAAAPGHAKRLVTVRGTDHGTALLAGRSAATALPAITAFLHRVLG